MKKIHFTKMAGAGNDFLIIEGAPKGVDLASMAPKACDRTNGVGADGVIVLDRSKKADFRMRIINADGSEAEMCGNGARCLAAYIVRHNKTKKKLFTIETLAGIITGEAKGEVARVTLSDPKDFKESVTLKMDGRSINASYIDTGVPHAVVYVQGIEDIDVAGIGPSIRYHEAFKPRGANANFVEIVDAGLVACRTYERGVEDETKACGTGSVASAIVSYLKLNPALTKKKGAQMKVKTKSGEVLEVTFDKENGRLHNVRLKGSAKFIAEGVYYHA
jgi:diaminopimelate epimerase